MNDSTESMSLLDQRRERMAKLYRGEKTDKVPFFLFADSYIPYYAGAELKDMTTFDYSADIHKKVMDEIQPDCTIPYIPINLSFAPTLALLGGGVHVIGENFIKQVNPASICIMEPDEYPALIKDPTNYLLETVYPRRFKLLANDNIEEKFNNILGDLMNGGQIGGYIAKCEEMSQVPLPTYGLYYGNPIDLVLGFLRNFTGIMSDIKRRPELLRDAGLAMADEIAKIMTMPMFQPLDYGMLNCPLNLPAFIKPKDFEAIYWPSFKKLTDLLLAQGHRIMFAFEKNYSHLYNYLQEFPKYKISGVFNEDDIRVVKKKLGDRMAIFGGLSVNLMRSGTKQECIDHVKGLIDDLGRDGGYCITPDIPMMTSADGKPENLKAVADTILAYGRN